MSSPLTSAETRRTIERLYDRLGSSHAVEELTGVDHATVCNHLRRRGLLRNRGVMERQRLAAEGKRRKALGRALAVFRAVTPERTLREAAELAGVHPRNGHYYLRIACEHLGVDYDAVRRSAKGGHGDHSKNLRGNRT